MDRKLAKTLVTILSIIVLLTQQSPREVKSQSGDAIFSWSVSPQSVADGPLGGILQIVVKATVESSTGTAFITGISVPNLPGTGPLCISVPINPGTSSQQQWASMYKRTN